MKELDNKRLWNYDSIVEGSILALCFFHKMVIADMLALFVNTIWESYREYGTIMLMLAAMAIGISRIMGIDLMENFNTLYFVYSVKEFWQR